MVTIGPFCIFFSKFIIDFLEINSLLKMNINSMLVYCLH